VINIKQVRTHDLRGTTDKKKIDIREAGEKGERYVLYPTRRPP